MKNIAYTLMLLGSVALTTSVNADDQSSAVVYDAASYSAEDFTIQPEWKKLFPEKSGFSITGDGEPSRFSTTSGEELYQTVCQACHMDDGQGASGGGDYPSFVGNKRLRTPYYAIDVTLNGFRGMPGFADTLSNEQIADVVNHLRTSFGNQLDDSTSVEDVARVRREQ